VSAALLLGKLQAHDPHLVYSSTESLPFSGPNGDVSIYQVTISNDGKRVVENVAGEVRIPYAKIEQYKITADPLLKTDATLSGDSLTIQIPSLNPSEAVRISLLASGNGLPALPKVAARASGVNGTEKTPTEQVQQVPTLTVVALAGFSTIFVSGSFAALLRKRSISGIPNRGEDQRQVLAFLCRAFELHDLAEQYSARVHETTYWAEADRLAQLAIGNRDNNRMQAIEQLLLALPNYAKPIAAASIAVAYYNVALINHARGNDAACKQYLALAKEKSSATIERRMKVDPRFGTK
jgi:hypothetical protein